MLVVRIAYRATRPQHFTSVRLHVVLVFFKGVVEGQAKLASSALLPILAILFFPRLIGFRCCLIHHYSCTIHSVFAHLEPPSVFLPIFLSLCFSGHPITRLPDLPITPPPCPPASTQF